MSGLPRPVTPGPWSSHVDDGDVWVENHARTLTAEDAAATRAVHAWIARADRLEAALREVSMDTCWCEDEEHECHSCFARRALEETP